MPPSSYPVPLPIVEGPNGELRGRRDGSLAEGRLWRPAAATVAAEPGVDLPIDAKRHRWIDVVVPAWFQLYQTDQAVSL
jgi:hypothetical protein